MVGIAVERTRSSFWPQGRSVTVEDLAAACAEDARAQALNALLVQRGTTRGNEFGAAGGRVLDYDDAPPSSDAGFDDRRPAA